MKKSYQLLCLLLTLLAFSTKSIAQNNLAAGDLAIVSYQSDTDPTNTFNPALLEFDDRFSMVVLRPGGLAAGTVIYITDRGWDGPNNIWLDEAYPPFTFGLGSEAVIKWVVPAGGIIQGKEVFFIGKYHDELPVGSEYYQWFAYSDESGTIPLGTITNETPIVPTALPPPNGFTDGMSLFSAGDNILVFQTGPPAGPATNYNDATRRFITAILANIRPTDVGVPTSYAAWDVAPNVQNESSIPPGLVNGQTCFLMSPGPLPHPTSPVPGTVEPDNGKFSNCALSLTGTCTALQMSALIYTTANWTYQNTVFAVGTSSSQCTYTVLPANTVTLSSAPGTNAQTVCINSAITNITYLTTVATGATVTGLPAGVSGVWAANVVTISGTPTATGTFNYTVTTTGGCPGPTATGSITVNPLNTIAAGANRTTCINTAITNITMATTSATGATFAGLPAGVTGAWAANVATISGTPTASGTFNYTVTTTGGCPPATATGTITVTANNTVTLSSAAGTDAQTVAILTPITNITYATTGATGATVTGLPPGVTGSWAANVVTISGSPTSAAGSPYTYTVTLTGGCGTITTTGTLTVTTCAVTLTSAAGTNAQSVCNNTAITNITYATVGATGATFSGLPPGVTGSWLADVVTISGTPTAIAVYNYTVTQVGGACNGTVANGTITVTGFNTVTLSSAAGTDAQTVCINTPITNITYATTVATGATVTGLPAGVTGAWAANVVTISGTPTVAGAALTYTVTLTGGCGGPVTATGTIAVTANNTVTLSSAAGTNAQTVCINTPITNITYTTTGATGATVTGLPAGVTGSWAANVVTISGTPTVAGAALTYTVTLTGGCGAITATGTITVTANNTITLTSAAGTNAQTVCVNTPITNITYSTTGATGATVTGLPAGVSGSWAANVVTISGTPSASGAALTYTITLTGGCGAITATGTITVNPNNTVTLSSAAGTDAQTVVVLNPITNITYATTGATGATFAGLPAGVTGSWAANVATISGTPTVTGSFNYTVTLTGGCGTVTATGNITVIACGTNTWAGTVSSNWFTAANWSCGVVPTAPMNVVIPAGTPFPAVVSAGTAQVRNFTTNAGAVFTNNGTVNVNGGGVVSNCGTYMGTGTFTGAMFSNNCATGIVSPGLSPGCTIFGAGYTNGSGTELIEIAGITPCTLHDQLQVVGTATLSGTLDVQLFGGFIPSCGQSFTIMTANTVTGTFATILYPAIPAGLSWNIQYNATSVVLSISGTPTATATPASQTTCSAAPITTIVLSGSPIAATTYNWTRDNSGTVTGIAASGSGDISGTLTNLTNIPITVTFTITPTSGSCTGASITATVQVNPTPDVNQPANQVVCNGVPTAAVTFTGSVTTPPGTVFNWTNSDPSIGLAASGTGNIASFTATNAGTTPVVATVTVTPSYTGGGGGPIVQTFNYTGALQTWVVPAGVTSVDITAFGAQGNSNAVGVTGGLGGRAQGTLAVVPGSTLNIYVGQGGAISASGGFNGGAIGGTSACGSAIGGGGGGASDVRAGGTALANRVIVAAGGGGAGGTRIFNCGPGSGGGGGGGYYGGGGGGAYEGTAGTGGTSVAGGTGGTGNFGGANGNNGALGIGGDGGAAPANAQGGTDAGPNGGNGGGLTGVTGGSGAPNWRGGGGGGGSSYFGGVTAGATTPGVQSGNGQVSITYIASTTCTGTPRTFTYTVNPTPVASITPAGPVTICQGSSVTLTASATCNSFAFSGLMSGAQEVPANASTARAVFNGTFNSSTNQLTLNVVFDGLTGGAATAAHVHNAAVGVNGPVIIPLAGFPAATSGSYTNTFTVPAAQVANLMAGNTYINIHNAGFPGGELRGQITNLATNVFTYSGAVSGAQEVPANGSTATGNFAGTYNNNTGQLTLNLIFNNLTGGNATAAHVHNAAVGVNGPVIIPLTAFPAATSGSYSNVFTMPPAQVANFLAGNTYINIHNAVFPGGEVRGQIAAPAAVCTGVTYLWSPGGATTQSITVSTANTYSVTATVNGCNSAPASVVVNVNPIPTVNAVANQIVCNGAPTTAVNFTGTPVGVVFNWTNSDPSIGLAASGTGNIASFTAINTGTAPVVATITVTPSYTNGGTTCTGTPITFTITVNPTPTAIATPASQTVCSATPIITIVITGNAVAGVVYNWVRDNTGTVTGIAASGAGNISGTLTNTTNIPITVTFTITPTANGCTGTPVTATVQVNPIPDVNQPANQVVCNGAPTAPVTFTGTVAGTVFNWTNNTPSIGLAASGTGDIASFTATNAGTTPVVATVVVTPTYTSGGGGPLTQTFNYTGALQTWVVPPGVTSVNITGLGAQGGLNGGLGASIGGTFSVTPGEVLNIIVGGQGGTRINNAGVGGGGGGTFVWMNTGSTLMLAAGGGGGDAGNGTGIPGAGSATNIPSNSTSGSGNAAGGSSGNGGSGGIIPGSATCNAGAGGGAGWLSDGINGAGSNSPASGGGIRPTAGAAGGNEGANCTFPPTGSAIGGFGGGGGGGGVSGAGGGGGGYNGGGGGNSWNGSTWGAGGGGGSYNIGTGQSNIAAARSGNGLVTITYAAGTICTGPSKTFTYTVNPTPNATATPASQTICSGSAITTIVNSGTVPGTVYNWVRDNPVVTGIANSGTGNISGTLTNPTNTPITVTFTVTPTYTNAGVTCTGTPVTATVVVNPIPTVNPVANQVVCNGAPTAPVNFSGAVTAPPGTVYNWVNNNTSIGLAASGTGNIASFTAIAAGTTPVTATITVTPSYTNAGLTCTGTPITFTITVNPTPIVIVPADAFVCNGSVQATGTYNFITSATGGVTTYTWTNNDISIGLGASGSGNSLPTFTATNSTNIPITATITVTPTYTNGGVSCVGVPSSFSITVYPTPNAVATPSTQTICSGTSITPIVLTSAVAGTTYTWTRDNTATVTGMPANGFGNNISGTLTNTTLLPVTVTFTITPEANGCVGPTTTATVLVNPSPDAFAAPVSQTKCSGTPITPIVLTSTVPGTTYTWTRDNLVQVTGMPASGSGSPISGTLSLAITSTAPELVTFTITPTSLGCVGTPITATVLVNPIPDAIATPVSQATCSGSAINTILLTSSVPGTTFAWTRDNTVTVTGIAASGTGNNIGGSLTNTTTAPITVTFTITPSFTNGGVTCTGPSITATVTVNPIPNAVATPASQTVCTGSPITTIVLSGAVSGTTYNWSRDNIATVTGIPASGTGNISGTLVNSTLSPVLVTFTIVPTANGCAGTPITATVLVNPAPNVNQPANQVVCNGAPTAPVTFTGSVPGTVFNWTNNTPSIGLAASGTGNIPSFIAMNTGAAPVVATIVVTPVFVPVAGGTQTFNYTGAMQTFTVPAGVTSVNISAFGAQGNSNAQSVTGGLGGQAQGTLAVTPGSTLNIYVGGGGIVSTVGGFNGGGSAGTSTCGSAIGGGGGGASDIRVGGTALTDRVIVAAGGGGAGGTRTMGCGPGSGGGGGGGYYGGGGGGGYDGGPGDGGTQIAGGNGGAGNFGGANGNIGGLGIGGDGGSAPANNQGGTNAGPNGGGGGGLTGITGGSGSPNWRGGGGGGGSSYIGGVTAGTTTAGVQSGNGQVVISWTAVAGPSCPGPSKTFTITVNPTPTVTPQSNRVFCNGVTTPTITFAGTPGSTYNWTNSNTGIGLAASGTGDIMPFVTTNATNGPITATITVTPVLGSCPGLPVSFTITVNPTPIVNPVTSQILCNGQTTAEVNFSSPNTGPTGSLAFHWTNSQPSIGLAANGINSIPPFVAVNTGLSPLIAIITVTAVYTNGGITCTGNSQTFTITVNPTPTVYPVPNQVLCVGSATAPVNFTGSVFGTIYNWTNNNPAIGLAAVGAGNIASFVPINTGNTPVVATITVTPNYTNTVTCPGAPFTFTITVNPIPTVNAVASQNLCNGASTAAVNFTGAVAGTVYNWTNNNTSIGLAASGTGNIASFTATNTTTVVQTATITVTPSYTNGGGTCVGLPITFTITVNPTPTVNAVLSQVLCSGASTAAVNFSGAVAGTVFNWTNNNTSIGLAASGTGNIASFVATNVTAVVQVATITVTPTFTNGTVTCTGTPRTFTITVNPIPAVNTVANQTVCNGTATAAVTFAGPVAGTVYGWTNNNTSIGLASGGTGNIASFTAINAGSTPVTATITVTPRFTNGGITCTGASTTFTITVNPTAVVNQPANQLLCNGAATSAVVFSGLPPGSIYNWTNNNTAIGLGASGTGNIPAFTATNTTTAPISATITVTPTSTGCGGLPVSFTITVNPTPSVNAIANQTLCAGATTAAVTISGPVAGTVYTWTNNNTTIGLGTSGIGNIPAFMTVNPTIAPVTATITVTPTYTNGGVSCTGNPVSFTITVNPLPNIVFTNMPERVCLTDTIVTLGASPAGGTWSGPGISGNTFSGAAAGIGVHRVTYTVTNSFGCTTSRFANIVVNDCMERHQVFQQAIRIWPNPNNGRFSLQFNSDIYKEFRVKIVNARGQEVSYHEFKNLVYGQILPFDLSRLADGAYFIYVYNSKESGVFPIIIQR